MTGRSVEIYLDTDLEKVPRVGREVNRLCTSLSMSDEESSHVELCVVEALNNVIKHSYGGEGGNRVNLRFAISRDRLVIEVVDKGMAMNPEEIEKARVGRVDPGGRDLSDLPERGRGLGIIKEYMDEVSYLSEGDENSLKMVKRLETE